MQPLDAITAMVPVVRQFERLGIPYYIGGSVASSFYGLARSTLDVDLVADLKPEHIAPLAAALQETYYVSPRMIGDAVARKSCFNLIYLPTSFKIDVFVLRDRPYDQEAIRRIRQDTFGPEWQGNPFFVASPEDVILAKLEWFRLGDEVSDRQWRDIIEVMKTQMASLDRDYLLKWAAELGVADLLERAWDEARS